MTSDSSKHDEQEMDVYSAVRWSALSKYGAQGMQFAVSIVLARLLAPEYFGLLGMATVITGFVKVFKNLGFGSAIIQRKEIEDKLLSTLFWVNLAVCVLITAILLALAPLTALMYDDPRVASLVMVLSLNFIVSGFSTIPSSLLVRRMQFKKLAIREVGGVLASGTTAITMALSGFGVWSLVAGSMAGSISQAILINLACPFRPRFVFDRLGLKDSLSFGLNLTGFNIFNYFARNADNLIIGIFLGPIALGYYAFAYRLMLLPRNAVTQLITRVMFPKFSRLQDDDEKLANTFLRMCHAIAFVTFPLMFGFAVVARDFVDVVLGEQWLPAVPLIWILAPLGALQSVWSPIGQLFLAKGRSDWYLRFGLAGGSLFACSFLAGIPWGVMGVAVAYCVACLVWIPVSYSFACRLVDGLSLARLGKSILPYVLASSVMMVAVQCCRWMLISVGAAMPVVLLLCVITGVVAYATFVLVMQPAAMADVVKLLPKKIAAPVSRLAFRGVKSS